MAAPLKILTVFGTRPEAIKLFPLVHALADDPRFESRVCISAQHREMLDQVLDIAGIVPDHDLDLMTPGQTLDALTARALVEIGAVLDEEKPDWVVVQGDTTTVMAGALAAYYRKIPVCHVVGCPIELWLSDFASISDFWFPFCQLEWGVRLPSDERASSL